MNYTNRLYTTPTRGGKPITLKPSKAGKNGSHVVFILDYSSSMQSCRSQTIEGYNEFLKTHKQNAKKNELPTYVSLYTFNGDNVNSVFYKRDVRKVDKLTTYTYNPAGMTNLYDAIGVVLHKIEKDIVKFKKKFRPDVNICILTDGDENASSSYGSEMIQTMVKKAEKKNWGFMFLGANIDAFAVGRNLGFDTHNTIQYDVNVADHAFRAAARSSVDLSNTKLAGASLNLAYTTSAFTEAERSSAMNTKSTDAADDTWKRAAAAVSGEDLDVTKKA